MAHSKNGEKHRTDSGETPIGEMGSGRTAVQAKKGQEPLTDAQRAFLAAYGEMGVILRACKVAEVGRQSHYDWMAASPEYERAFAAAQEDAADNLEAEVYRRAVKGVKKPVGWYKGVAGGKVREYSDVLLMFRLKALRPEKYRERQEIAVTGSLANLNINSLPDALVKRIADGEPIQAVLASGAEQGLAALQPYLKQPLALPPASTEDGGAEDAAGPPYPADRATGE